MATTRIIYGCGYLGLRVGRLWSDTGDRTWAITRKEHRRDELSKAGMLTAQGDVAVPDSLRNLRQTVGVDRVPLEAVLYAVGFDRAAGFDIHTVYADGLRNVLSALPPTVERIIYISTTGVYGPHGGQWVDENTPPDPRREGGQASLAAERVLAALPLGPHSAILRLSGLYGPGRVPHVDKLRAGEPLPVPADGWLNLIHVDDAARAVVAADAWLAAQTLQAAPAAGPHIFCVTDDVPVQRRQYYQEVARILKLPPPRFCEPPTDSPAAARAAANRRISNKKLHNVLGVSLDYPSYRDGLTAILSETS